MHYAKQEKPLGELLSDLSYEVQDLIRKELKLAKSEMTWKMSRSVKDMRSLAMGGAVLYAGALAIVAGLVIILGMFVPLWASALIVGAIVAGAGYLMVRKGINDLKRIEIKPEETVSSIREGGKWLRERKT